MLHVSDLMREMKCDCFCWNSAHNSLHQESFYKMDCPFSDLWRNYLNANECGLGHSMDSNEQSLKLYVLHALNIRSVEQRFLILKN